MAMLSPRFGHTAVSLGVLYDINQPLHSRSNETS